ncbi:MAG: NAD(P)/FAD-dependent oxidoreductase [Leptospiraceae bacterium]|nr:NAD(P)/FAD-dependent oxidoreductase [Leptospiraceae bacterium]
MSAGSWPPKDSGKPHLVIIGGGFGGLTLARKLRRAPVYITLIDKANHHLFQPLLYQVATASLSPGHIAMPLRAIFRSQKNVRVLMNRVAEIVAGEKKVRLVSGDEFTYDRLVIATGARHSYFAHPEWEKNAPGLKSLADALRIRQKILATFERAEMLLAVAQGSAEVRAGKDAIDARSVAQGSAEVRAGTDTAELKKLLTFVIVGGGPTGVELAGSIAEIAHHTLRKEFRSIDPHTTRVILVEGGDHLLMAFPGALGKSAEETLKKLGVEVRTKSIVKNVMYDGVYIGDELISSANIFWAAGNTASTVLSTLGTRLDAAGRAVVGSDLSLSEYPEISVIGDAAHCVDHASGKPLPGVAPVAIQQGQYLSRKIAAELKGKKIGDFRYWDKGSMATIGRGRAVAKVGKLQFSGMLAWLMWSFIHVLYLVGFRNRFAVMVLWMYSYITNSRTVRLITSDDL